MIPISDKIGTMQGNTTTTINIRLLLATCVDKHTLFKIEDTYQDPFPNSSTECNIPCTRNKCRLHNIV